MSKSTPIKTQLRMPADLQVQLVAATETSGRSMNSEIVTRLEQSLNAGPDLSALIAGMAALTAAEATTQSAYWAYAQASAGAQDQPAQAKATDDARRTWHEAIAREAREGRRVADLILDICRLHDSIADRLFPDGIPDL